MKQVKIPNDIFHDGKMKIQVAMTQRKHSYQFAGLKVTAKHSASGLCVYSLPSNLSMQAINTKTFLLDPID